MAGKPTIPYGSEMPLNGGSRPPDGLSYDQFFSWSQRDSCFVRCGCKYLGSRQTMHLALDWCGSITQWHRLHN